MRTVYIECTRCPVIFRAEIASPAPALPPCPACGGELNDFVLADPEESGVFPNLWLAVGRRRDGTAR